MSEISRRNQGRQIRKNQKKLVVRSNEEGVLEKKRLHMIPSEMESINIKTIILSNASIISNIIPFGIWSSVLTGSNCKYEFSSFVVVVLTFGGLVSSCTAVF